jgi:hypothetical protein
VALVGGEHEPRNRPLRIATDPRAFDVEHRELVLRLGIAEVRRCVIKHPPCPFRARGDRRIGDAGQVILPQRYERVGDIARAWYRRIIVGVAVGEFAEILKRPVGVGRHAVPRRIHATELPQREAVPVLGGVLQRTDRAGFFADAERLGSQAIGVARRRLHIRRRLAVQ